MSSLTRRRLSHLSQETEPLPVSVTMYLGFCNWSGLQAKNPERRGSGRGVGFLSYLEWKKVETQLILLG